VCALEQLGLLYIGGEDATEFLQNQLSNDISHIDASKAQLSSFSNAKGRMIGIFRVIQIEGGYLLLMPLEIIAEVGAQLQKYVLRSQVVVANISDSFARLAVTAENARDLLDRRLPTDVHQVFQSDSLIALCLPALPGQQRYLLLSNDENEAVSLAHKLLGTLTFSDEDSWRLQEILCGIPSLYQPTIGAFVVQMANLQVLDGVSFKKGCYPGQEVVARMQYLGKLKRRMFLAKLDTDSCPQPGDKLQQRAAEQRDGSGKVVDAISDGSACLMLYIAQIDKAESDELVLAAQPGAHLERLELPYPIEAA
jgi:folate-binding protein YgfZ